MNRLMNYQWPDLPKMVGLAFLYAILIRIVFGDFAHLGPIPNAWLPSGLGLAILIIGGAKLWPGVFVGAFAAYIAFLDKPFLLASLMAMCDAMEPIITIWLLTHVKWKKFHFDPHLDHARDYIGLGLAGAVGAGIAAFCGTTFLLLTGTEIPSASTAIFLRWWIGNSIGILLLTPLILIWRHRPPGRINHKLALEAAACFGLAFIFGQIIFLGWFSSLDHIINDDWMFLFLIWAAVRFGRHGTSLLISMTAIQAFAGLVLVGNIFEEKITHATPTNLWIYVVIYAAVGTTLALVVNKIWLSEKLRKSEERWKFALEGAGDGVWDWDIQNNTAEFSKRYMEMYGFNTTDIITHEKAWAHRIHPDDRAQVEADINAYLEGRTSSYVNEHRVICKDGSLKWVLARGMVVSSDADGKPLRMIGTHSDITERKQIENELRLAATTFETHEAILITDAHANIIRVNQMFQTITGYSAEDVLGRNPRLLQSGRHDADFYKEMWHQLLKNGTWSGEIWDKHKSGKIYPKWSTITAVKNERGEITQYVAIFNDITKRKEFEESLRRNEERFRHMLEISPIAVRIKRASDHRLVFVNQAYAAMFNTTKDMVIGETPEKFYHTPQDFQEINEVLSQGETFINQPLKLRTIDGQDIWVLASFTHIEYENDLAILGWFYDVTKLRKAKEIAEETAAIKSNFLASMSHEIRTPMNAIVGLSQLALNKQTSPDVRDYLEKIHLSSQSLLGILNDILDFSKLDAGRVNIEKSEFNLESMLRNLHRLFSLNAEQKFLEFEIETLPDVPRNLIGDALRIQQILSNLLGNAIKFTEHGKVVLKISLLDIVGNQVRILFQVKDTGIGMSEKEMATLFVPFSQADGSITRRFGGTGLGLAISNNLLQLMGSEFSVQSSPGKGTTFGFELTLNLAQFDASHVLSPRVDRRKKRREAGALASELHDRSESVAGARVLLAEDNIINQQVARDFLSLSGIHIEIANNGEEVLALLEKTTFDAILMDVNMPVMSGLEATKIIREQERFKDLPIIALAAGVTQEERDNCLAIGMNHFVPKPIDPELLVAVLSNWIKLSPQPGPETTTSLPEEAGNNLQSLPGFDLEKLLKMLRGDQSRVMHLLRNFREEFSEGLTNIESKINAGDLNSAEKLVHTLKGAAGSMGAKSLHEISEKFDAELKQGKFSPTTFDEFRLVFESTMACLASLPPQ